MSKIQDMIRLFDQLRDMGFTLEEAQALRRIEMTLHRWAELECGDGNNYGSWAIERDTESEAHCTQCGEDWYGEKAETENCPKCGDCAPVRRKATGKPFMVHHYYLHRRGKDYVTRTRVPDREAGALKRLAKIIEARNCRAETPSHGDSVIAYHQGDPRGCALYIVRASDVPAGQSVNSFYTRGVAVAA